MENFDRLKAQKDKYTADDVQAVVEKLRGACKLYCHWYDNGQPDMSVSSMAYEMVSHIRQAIHALSQGEEEGR